VPIIFVGVLEIVVHGPTSPVLNPLPVIVTGVPLEPVLGVREIVGEVVVIMKVAVPKSPLLPRTFTTYVPGVVLLTMKAVLVN
jgi:hypothetical protein